MFIHQNNKTIMKTLIGTIEVIYVFSGVSPKNGKPYLQISNGIEASFVKLSQEIDIAEFKNCKKGEMIEVRVIADGSGVTVDGLVN